MRLRLLPSVLLLSASSYLLGQNLPDFSGVYLRDRAKSELRAGAGWRGQRIRQFQEVEQALDDGSMLILVVTQTAESIEVTKIQNGAKTTSNYDLNMSKSKRAHSSGSGSAGHARFRKGALVIHSSGFEPSDWYGGTGLFYSVTERWELSPDSRILTVRRTPSRSGIETYSRQPSLDSALARASEASLMNKCVCLRLSFPANSRTKDWDEAELGFTAYRQLNKCTLFDAGLWGEFFKGLERIDTPDGTQFRKSGQVVSEFPDDVVLEVSTKIDDCAPGPLWVLPMITSASPIPPELFGLRFRVRWASSATRDLGEPQSEFFTEPWPELGAPEKFYRIQIPSKGVRVTDDLEIRILTSAGNQIGCISGHI